MVGDQVEGRLAAAAWRIATRQVQRQRDGLTRAVVGGWTVTAHEDDPQLGACDEHRWVLTVLGCLPAQQRLVMAWHLDGFDTSEIADCLGISAADRPRDRRMHHPKPPEVTQATTRPAPTARSPTASPTVSPIHPTPTQPIPAHRPPTDECELTGLGLHGFNNIANVTRSPIQIGVTRRTPCDSTNSACRSRASTSSPCTVNDRCTLRSRASTPTVTRISHTPG